MAKKIEKTVTRETASEEYTVGEMIGLIADKITCNDDPDVLVDGKMSLTQLLDKEVEDQDASIASILRSAALLAQAYYVGVTGDEAEKIVLTFAHADDSEAEGGPEFGPGYPMDTTVRVKVKPASDDGEEEHDVPQLVISVKDVEKKPKKRGSACIVSTKTVAKLVRSKRRAGKKD